MRRTLSFTVPLYVFLALAQCVSVALAQEEESSEDEATDEDASAAEATAWEEALSFDREAKLDEAFAAYRAFLKDYPQSDHTAVALDRLSFLRERLLQAQRDLYEKIRVATDAGARIELCRQYMERYPDGVMIDTVKTLKEQSEDWVQHVTSENQAMEELRATTDPNTVLSLAERFKSTFPESKSMEEVEELEKAARKAIKKERRKVGKKQRVVGIVFMASGLAVGAGGLITGHSAKVDYEALEDECDDRFDGAGCEPGYKVATKDNIKTKAAIADISMGVGLAMAVTGLIVYLLAPSWEDEKRKDDGAQVSVGFAPTGDGSGAMIGIGGSL